MMDRDDLTAKFAEVVGVEKAAALVDEGMAAVGIPDTDGLSNQDARDVCEAIQHDAEGYVALIAGELRVQLEAQERFAALLENVPDPAVVVEFENREPRVKTVNEAFETAFGHDRTTAAGRSLADLIAPADCSARAVAEQWLGQGQSEQEVRRVTASGEVRTFLFRTVSVVREGGGVEGYGIYTDITERQRRRDQLEHQNERLDEFVSIVSHDLRNPLSVALGQVGYLLETVEDDEVRRHLQTVEAAHDRMRRMLDELLELARQGQVVGDTSPVDVTAVAADAWRQVPTGDASLSVPDEVTVEADPDRLQQLFENLFRNAMEHGTSADGSVDSATAASHDGDSVTVTVGRLADGNGFYVADDGPGIPPEDRDTVFDHGYTTDDEGTGFGLSIVQRVAEAHGWTVDATESDSGGARFDFGW